MALLPAAATKLKTCGLSLGHWNEAMRVVKTVLLITKPAVPGPSMPIEALKEL